MGKPKPDKNTLYEVERHINNYFNPANDPDSNIRKYPDAFLELVEKIVEFKKYIADKKNAVTFVNDGYSESYDINSNSWQSAFSPELAVYKRAKFI